MALLLPDATQARSCTHMICDMYDAYNLYTAYSTPASVLAIIDVNQGV